MSLMSFPSNQPGSVSACTPFFSGSYYLRFFQCKAPRLLATTIRRRGKEAPNKNGGLKAWIGGSGRVVLGSV